jgi:hypothetical protein
MGRLDAEDAPQFVMAYKSLILKEILYYFSTG